jgi:hypothetical protein
MDDPITISLAGRPASLEAFLALHAELAATPEGGTAALVAALLAFAEDAELGERCLGATVDAARLAVGAAAGGGRRLGAHDLALVRRQMARNPYLAATYVRGTSLENGYTLPAPPWQVACSANPYSGDRATGPYKLFVICSGAASPRPVSLRPDEAGLWRPFEWSSLLVGVRAPER